MEDPVKPEECATEMVVVPKKKTLKQARLPFQMLSSADSISANKKRKLASPTLVECKSPKLLKTSNKPNSFDSPKAKVTEVIDLDADDDKASEQLSEKITDETIDKESSDLKITPKTKSKKHDEKSAVKMGSLTRFLTKTDSKDSPKNKSESLKENAKPALMSVADVPMEVEETIKPSEMVETVLEDTKVEATETAKSEKIEKEENEKDETDVEEGIDVLKFDSDSESSEDEQAVDNKTDVDESEEKKKTNEEIKTPVAKKDVDFKQKKMTPKQLERHLERQKREEERKQQKLEREKKREEERENRKRLKEEKKKEKDEKEKAEREQKKKEKEQKELKKQMEIEQKQREKEEEKRKKEEEKLEAERKKQKAASTFVSFFVTKKPSETKTEQKAVENKNFMPFEVKADMRIAPVCRRTITDEEKRKFDENWEKQSLDKLELYLGQIKNKTVLTRKSGKTWPPETKEEENDDDVVIIEDDDNERNYNTVDRGNVNLEKHRAKLLMFTENRRPPYRGTWRKKSSLINPRKPFTKDEKWFDYEVDSDEEWEEEEPGESLHGSDDEKDEENPDDNEYDVDNDFMVPHGYLSEEEAQAEDDEDLNPETQKFKLKILGEQFEAERNAKTTKLKPKVIGCTWKSSDNTFPSNIHSQVLQLLQDREIWINEIPINLQSTADNESLHGSECGTPSGRFNSGPGAKKTLFPEEAVPDLIRLVHGNVNGRGFLVKEFICFWTKKNDLRMSKVSVSKKIREIAKWSACLEEGPMHQKNCWLVSEEVRKKYLGTEDCGLPNRWNYILTPKKRVEIFVDKTEKDDKEKDKDKEKKSVPLITQFTKKFTPGELQKQLSEATAAKSTPPLNKKRVALISVAKGEKFPKSPRISLLDKFMVGDNSSQNQTTVKKKTNDDIIVIEDDKKNDETKAVTEQDKQLSIREETKVENSEKKEDNETKRESNEKTRNNEAKEVESEDDCIMILDDSHEEKDTQKNENTNLDDNEKNVSPSQTVINNSEKSEPLKDNECKMETSITE